MYGLICSCWEAFINTLVGGWAKWRRGQKSFELPEGGGDQKVFRSKGGVKKFGQIESIMKLKMHNLLPKLTGYSLRLDLYFKIYRVFQRARHCTLHLKCLRSHILRYACHLFREPRVQIYRGWL